MNKTSTGHCSTGHYSTGDRSTGDYSTGYYSTGNRSTGDYSTGYYSTGHWSISNYSTGHFSTIDDSGFGAFDKPCTRDEWNKAVKPDFLFFNLIEWIVSDKMTDKEKSSNPAHVTTGGYLKVFGYQEAFRVSWDKAKDRKEQYALLTKLPNWDEDVFEKIAGFRPSASLSPSLSGKEVKVTLDGREYTAIIK